MLSSSIIVHYNNQEFLVVECWGILMHLNFTDAPHTRQYYTGLCVES